MSRSGPITRDTTTIALGISQIRIAPSAAYIATVTAALSATDSIGALANTNFKSDTTFFDLESGYPAILDATFPLKEANSLECAFKEITPKNLAIARGLNPFADISATMTEVGSTTAAGTTTGAIAVTDDTGPTTETWTVVFTGATTAGVYGSLSGHVGDLADLTTAFAPVNGASTYFTIPASFFSGTWALDETYVFSTTAFIAGTTAYADNHAGNLPLGTVAAPKYLRVESVYTFPDAVHTMTIVMPRVNVKASLALDMQETSPTAVTMSLMAMNASSDVTGGNAVWDNMPAGQIIFG